MFDRDIQTPRRDFWLIYLTTTRKYRYPIVFGNSLTKCFDLFDSGYPNTEKRVENTISTQRIIFDEIRGVWIADETLSRVFDISSQSKQKLMRKSRGKIVKIYAN